MAKTKVSEWSSTPGANTDIDGINLAEGMLPSDVNNAMREMMSQLKDLQSANPTYYTSNSDAIAVGAGGTGAITAAAARTNLGLAIGTNVMAYVAPSTSGNVLTSNGTSWISSALSTGVTSFSAGTTGLTPSTGTTGAVTLDGTLAIANGGTNNNALAVTAGGVIYTDGTKLVNVGVGSSGQLLKSNGSSAPSWTTFSASGTLLGIQYFTTAGTATYTPTSGTTFVIVEVVGGGGGGGGAYGTGVTAGGGASGGYARKKITSAFSGVTVTVGAGGGGSNNPGSTGGTSSFGALVSATGGGGGSLNGTGVTAGGSGSSGDINIAGTYANINRAGSPSPIYGSSAGNGTTGSAQAGQAGIGYGSGGGGSTGSNLGGGTGGTGSVGIVIVYEYA